MPRPAGRATDHRGRQYRSTTHTTSDMTTRMTTCRAGTVPLPEILQTALSAVP